MVERRDGRRRRGPHSEKTTEELDRAMHQAVQDSRSDDPQVRKKARNDIYYLIRERASRFVRRPSTLIVLAALVLVGYESYLHNPLES